MKKIIAIFILAVGFISCTSNDETKIDNSDLVGTWNWFGTNGGLANHMNTTPATTGKIVQINLTKNYTYTITENSNEVSNGTYKLTLGKSIYSGEMVRFIQCSGNNNVQNVVINGVITIYETNKLDISDNNYDGIGSVFEKIK